MAKFDLPAASAVTVLNWTPSLGNVTLGDNGAVSVAAYQFGTIVFGSINLVVGSDTVISGSVSVNLPATSATGFPVAAAGTYKQVLSGEIFDVSGVSSGPNMTFYVKKVGGFTFDQLESGDFAGLVPVDATTPFAYADGDVLIVSFMYEGPA